MMLNLSVKFWNMTTHNHLLFDINVAHMNYNERQMSPASIGGGFHFRLSVVGYNPPLKPGGAEAPGARCSRSLRP